jgi:hypothetical protein
MLKFLDLQSASSIFDYDMIDRGSGENTDG